LKGTIVTYRFSIFALLDGQPVIKHVVRESSDVDGLLQIVANAEAELVEIARALEGIGPTGSMRIADRVGWLMRQYVRDHSRVQDYQAEFGEQRRRAERAEAALEAERQHHREEMAAITAERASLAGYLQDGETVAECVKRIAWERDRWRAEVGSAQSARAEATARAEGLEVERDAYRGSAQSTIAERDEARIERDSWRRVAERLTAERDECRLALDVMRERIIVEAGPSIFVDLRLPENAALRAVVAERYPESGEFVDAFGCLEFAPQLTPGDAVQWICTRPRDHSGPHVAHGVSSVLGWWPNHPAPEAK
jgi:hypothetical protein